MFNIFKWFSNKTQSKDLNLDSKNVNEIHQMSDTVRYTVNIPGHNARTESSVFAATKKHLIDDLDTPCWVCGSKENREVHHFILEYSLANAVDWNKLKALCPDFPDWDKIDPNNPDTFKYFTDHAYNMRILCTLHHRQSQGIHRIPYPIWNFIKIKKDDFEFFPDSKGLFDIPMDDLS
jgi:hypothetical protein